VITVDKLITTTLIGTTAPINFGNKNGTEEVNIRTCSKPIGTTALNTGFVLINVTDSPSYAKLVIGERSRKIVNFRTLITPAGNGADVVVPLESIRVVSEWFANSAYGFFLGKRVAYLVVANNVMNMWSKYGLVKSMLNSSNGLFFFQFSSKDGLDAIN
ncbi:hypothetical protein Tco_0302157, partial [Tanacetum coccineum]